MDIKKRRRRRVATLIIVTLTIVGALAGVMWLQGQKREKEAQWHRAEGLAAVEAGNHAAGIEHLRRYLDRRADDAEAQHAFAKANLEVPQARNGHFRQALGALRQAVALDPDNHEATRELIEIYRLIGANEQTLELTDRLLAADPRDATAMGDRAIALSRMGKGAEAREAAEAAVEMEPNNYRLHMILLQVQQHLKTSREELVAYGAGQAEKHPGDPRFELVAGLACAIAGGEHTEAANRWLRQAAGRPLPEPGFAADLVAVLDTLGLWGDSIVVLERAADLGETNLATDYARRLLEAERFEPLVDRFGQAGDGGRALKLEQQVLLAMALQNLGRHEESGRVIASMAERNDSPLAPVWAEVLRKAYDANVELPRRVEAIKEAMTTIIDDAYLHALLGDANASLGDQDMALQHWQRAAELRPSWGGVRLLVARAMLNVNRPKDAVGYAEAAMIRLPDSLPAAVTVVRARAEAMGTIDGDTPQRLLDLAEKVQQAAPGEPQTLIAMVDMLPRVGRKDEAQRIATELIGREGGLRQELLGRLAEVSRRHALGLDEALQQQYAAQMEGTPELALTRATGMARRGQTREGLALLDRGLVEAPTGEKLSWELARAAYLDAVDDPGAAATWVKLADNNADDRRVQQMALRARSVQGDRAFTERVLNRLQTQMGEGNVAWLTERARWLAGSGREHDATQAVTMLRQVIERAPKRVEPRVLLAQTLMQLNRPQLAIQELRAGEQAVPKSISLWMELARLYQAERDFANALNYLDQVLASPDLDDGGRREAASLLARQGEHDRAIQLVERLTADDGGSPDERLLLASLYARAGRTADAERLMPSLLEEPTAPSLAMALEFYSTRGDEARVRDVLSRLEAAAIPDAAKRRVLGEYAARTGRLDEAAEHLEAASAATPHDADIWRQRTRLHLMRGQGQEAIRVAQEALKHVAHDAGLRALVEHAQLATSFAADPWGRRMLLAMVEDPGHAEPATAALRALGGGDAQAAATSLNELARANPGFLSLQLLAARRLLETRQAPAAVDVATRATLAFPDNLEAMAVQAEAMAAAGRWRDALATASEWRRRSDPPPLSADLIMAEAHLQLGQPDRALERLEPHAEAARTRPDDNREVAARLLRALVALRRYDDAEALIEADLATSPTWRSVVLTLAATTVEDPGVAAAWVRKAEATVAASDVRERMATAQAWWMLSERVGDPAMLSEAARAATELTALPDAPALAWYQRGVIAERGGDMSAAEPAYREAIRRDPSLAAAKNNLAMVLVQSGNGSDEALRLAEAAVTAEPENTAYLDTLAAAQAVEGQTDAAVQTMQKVIGLEPTTKLWYENLARILREADRPDEAQQVLDRYEARALRM